MDIESMIVEITAEAGIILRGSAFRDVYFEWKGEDDPVTELDRRVERYIKKEILKNMGANFIGEEYGFEDRGADYTFIIDPIDGTKSFMRKDFLSSISVAVEREGNLVAGVVYDFMKDIMYAGFGGQNYLLHAGQRFPFPKRLDGKKIRLSLDGDDLPDLSGIESHPLISTQKRGGSIALSLAHLAANAYDGNMTFTRGKGNSWDVAAGFCLVKSAGFWVADMDGRPFDYRHPVNGILAVRQEYVGEVVRCLGLGKTPNLI